MEVLTVPSRCSNFRGGGKVDKLTLSRALGKLLSCGLMVKVSKDRRVITLTLGYATSVVAETQEPELRRAVVQPV
jgi:hypothetical protein